MPVTIDGSNGITTPMYNGSITANAVTPSVNMKNRIINGAMTISQRNGTSSVTPTDGQYTIDRWKAQLSQASKYTVQQDAGAVTPPAGFTDYLGVTSSSAYSVLSSDVFFLVQPIEGFNTADFAWGTANAKTVTLSFWVRSSLTGTFGGSLRNNAGNRSYPFTFTINSANTWEYETITIAGDTTGTWTTDNSTGISVSFSLGCGSTFTATGGAWAAGNFVNATGATSVVGTNGATFYITGVQLEVGSTATSFDYRPYGTELALCQRYCQVYGGVSSQRFTVGWWFNSTDSFTHLYTPVSFRKPADISVSTTSVSNFRIYSGGSSLTPTSITLDIPADNCITLAAPVSSGGTTGWAAVLLANNTSAKITISNEL